MTGITRIEAAFFAAAADTDLPGRVIVVEPRNAGARVVIPDLIAVDDGAARWSWLR